MSIRNLLFAFTALIFVSTAHAEDEGAQATSGGPSNKVGSEYLHQAVGGNFELTPGTGIYTSRIEAKNSSDKSASTILPITVKGEYGFSDLFSLSAQLGVGLGATDNSCTAPALCDDTVEGGMMDPMLSANFRIPVGIATLRFGADLSTSVGKRKIDSNGDSNLASGGTMIAPYLGADFVIGSSVFGAKLSYDVYKGDRSVQDDRGTGSSYKFTDEKELDVAVFYEYNFPKIVSIGAALEYTDSPESKTDTNGVKTLNGDAATVAALKVYVPLHFSPRATLVPALTAGGTDYKSRNSMVKNQTNTALGVIARFTF